VDELMGAGLCQDPGTWDDQDDGDAESWDLRWYGVDSCRRRKTVRRRRCDGSGECGGTWRV